MCSLELYASYNKFFSYKFVHAAARQPQSGEKFKDLVVFTCMELGTEYQNIWLQLVITNIVINIYSEHSMAGATTNIPLLSSETKQYE